ncbi:hypothetical protein [Bifidobacterium callitrichos]|uniref:hypothetical protein n=1 Tax=Bifidobacterium callitrichos TaxID=762209 RepID=UPI0005BA1CB6|nr:hypothetical protein [Bifidobacterium callitrichos]
MADRFRVLMCRDHPVLEYEYFATGGYVLRVVRIFDESRIDEVKTPDGHQCRRSAETLDHR